MRCISLISLSLSLSLARSLAFSLSLFLDNSHVNATTCVRCFRSKHDTSVLVKQHMGKLRKVPRSIDGKYFSIIIIIIVVTIIIIIIFVHSIITLLFLRQTVFCTFTDHYCRIPSSSSSFPSSSSFFLLLLLLLLFSAS